MKRQFHAEKEKTTMTPEEQEARAKQVKEYNDSQIYTTDYEYTLTNKLKKITEKFIESVIYYVDENNEKIKL